MIATLGLVALPSISHGATRMWSGPGTELMTAANWGGTAPTASGDVAQFNGTVGGSLSLVNSSTTATLNGGGTTGLTWYLSGAQTGNVSVDYTGTNSSNSYFRLGATALTVDSGAGALTFGNGVGGVAVPSSNTGTALKIVLGSGGTAQTITFTNNSVNAVTFESDVYFSNGGGSAKTMSFAGSGNFVLNSIIGPDVSGNKGVQVVGSGTVTLSAANTYANATTINSGTLALGASDRISNSSALVLGGGTFATGGFSETLNTLTVSGASIIDFGTGTSALVFADSSATNWTGTVTLLNFDIGTDSLNFSSISGLTVAQLADISLTGYTATGLEAGGFVQFSAIPEPSTYAILFGGLALVGAVCRRRRAS